MFNVYNLRHWLASRKFKSLPKIFIIYGRLLSLSTHKRERECCLWTHTKCNTKTSQSPRHLVKPAPQFRPFHRPWTTGFRSANFRSHSVQTVRSALNRCPVTETLHLHALAPHQRAHANTEHAPKKTYARDSRVRVQNSLMRAAVRTNCLVVPPHIVHCYSMKFV